MFIFLTYLSNIWNMYLIKNVSKIWFCLLFEKNCKNRKLVFLWCPSMYFHYIYRDVIQFISPATLTLMLNIIIDKKNLNPFIFNDIQFLSSLQKVTLENKEVLTFIDKFFVSFTIPGKKINYLGNMMQKLPFQLTRFIYMNVYLHVNKDDTIILDVTEGKQ